MATKITAYIGPAAMHAVRPGDALSQRLNQILERYQLLMRFNPLTTLALSAERRLDLRLAMPPPGTPTGELQTAWVKALAARDDALAVFISKCSELEVFQCLEALEEADHAVA